jgi:hypothetical protein
VLTWSDIYFYLALALFTFTLGSWSEAFRPTSQRPMAAGLRSKANGTVAFRISNPHLCFFLKSRNTVILRSCSRIPPDHPVLCPMAELVATSCRCAVFTIPLKSFDFQFFLALTFVLAPLPNAVFPHCCGADEYATSYEEGSGPIDLGRFITAMIVVTGFALPIVLAHSGIINPAACAMSIIGGG